MSPKTLQCWRTEGRGAQYLKLSKRVAYPLKEIKLFESNALFASTSKRMQSTEATASSSPDLLTAQVAAAATSLPAYLFCNKRVRRAVDVPCLHINASLRFNLLEVRNWTLRWSTGLEQQGIEPQ